MTYSDIQTEARRLSKTNTSSYTATELNESINWLNENISNMGNTAVGVFDQLGSTIVDSLTGADAGIESFVKSMGQFLLSLVKKFLAAAVAALALAVAISLIPGMAGDVFGKADAGIKFGGAFMKGFKGFAGMAEGGVVPSGYPNDSYPTMLTSGETVTPPHKLANNSGSIEVHGILRGKDIYLSSEKYKSNQNRLT